MRNELMPGFSIRETDSGFLAIELDYWADPTKDDAWRESMQRRMKNPRRFAREYLRDWQTPSGSGFYPEYLLIPDDRRLFKAERLIEGPIYRGWDLGYRRPACVWFQYSPKSNRIAVLRELLPFDIDTHSFRDLVLYLSGELPIDALTTKALEWVARISADADAGRTYPPPWFAASGSVPLHFIDFAGPEAQRISAQVEHDSKERNDAQILEAGGVYLQIFSVTVEARTETLRRLMRVREDGWPGIVLDPSCRTLYEGFAGKIVFKQKTPNDPLPAAPMKDGYYEHLHDALGYALVNVVPAIEAAQRLVRVETRGPGWAQAAAGVVPGGPIRRPVEESDDKGLTGWTYG